MRVHAFAIFVLAAAAGCGGGLPADELTPIRAPQVPRVVAAQEALDTAEVATLDPHTMNNAEIGKVLGEGPFCAFRYVSYGKPVLAWKRQPGESGAAAVVKLNGLLVRLLSETSQDPDEFAADAVRLRLKPSATSAAEHGNAARPQETQLVFEIDRELRVGYGGYSDCPT